MTKHFGLGISLKFSTDGTTTYGNTLNQIISIGGPESDSDEIDTSDLDLVTNAREFSKGLNDLGMLNISVFYDPGSTTHKAIHAMYRSRTIVSKWKLIYATTTIIDEFDGWVKSIGREIEVGQYVRGTFGVRLTGNSTGTLPWAS